MKQRNIVTLVLLDFAKFQNTCIFYSYKCLGDKKVTSSMKKKHMKVSTKKMNMRS